MRKYILSLLAAMLAAVPLLAQDGGINLLVQSPDGKTVKLVWLVNSWPASLTSFDVKRQDGLDNWVTLNSEPIVPGIYLRKKLSFVEADRMEESRIKNKLYDLVEKRRVVETQPTEMLTLVADENRLSNLVRTMARDYDIALASGFGYVDHGAKQKMEYKYGLFAHGSDSLLATATWNYGEIPDLNVVNEITSRSVPGKTGIQVFWNADMNKMKAAYVVGFNIYRAGIRLNDTPIVAANMKDPSEFTWMGRTASSAQQHQYSISAQSIFGIEGIIKSYNYNPADHSKDYRKAEVSQVSSLGYYFKDGISISWTFPKDYERYLKGFYVEKDNMPQGYTQVSPLLDPATRNFVDHTASPVTSFLRTRIIAVYKDKCSIPGKDRLHSYFPITEAPRPFNFKAAGEQGDKKYTITFTWDPPMTGDSATVAYRLYKLSNMTGRMEIAIDNIPGKSQVYKYTVTDKIANSYSFALVALNRNRNESPFSDTTMITALPTDIPSPNIAKITAEDGRAVIRWQYSETNNLLGYRLYRNGEQVTAETETVKGKQTFKADIPDAAANYEFSIRAVFESGTISEPSAPVQFSLPKP